MNESDLVNIYPGRKFRDRVKLHHIVNVFFDNDEIIVTYKYWSTRKWRWYYETDYACIFIIRFTYGGCKWDCPFDKNKIVQEIDN